MVLVYIFTTIITAVWLTRSILAKKFIFRRTLLDLPLMLFLLSQILATVFSIDRYTSIFGYPSRLNGGLLSTIAYCLLYWAYVSNIEKSKVFLHIKALLFSGVIVSIWAIFEHFGHSFSCLLVTGQFDVDCWVQNVQARVFASTGQPNWLAAWIVALSPLTWSFALNAKIKNYLPYVLSTMFFVTLLFTKSRSGLLGFIVAGIIFWVFIFLRTENNFRNILNKFLIFNFSFLILIAIVGTPWTPSFFDTTMKQSNNETIAVTVLETGGTESGIIRKIVWRGAFNLWRSYPLLGTGVETFAYSYYKTRPIEHNLTTEWDFLYNKAHNEFLNMAANSGSIGLITYLFLIFTILLTIPNFKFLISKQTPISKFKNSKIGHSLEQLGQLEIRSINIALLAGFASLLVTNFFGFSVVLTNLEFFLFPAFGIVLGSKYHVSSIENKLNTKQKFIIFGLILTTLYVILSLGRYWYADYQFAKGRRFTDQSEPKRAVTYLTKAISLNPQMAQYHDQLALAYSLLAPSSEEFIKLTIQESDIALALAPYNVSLLKSRANIYTDLSIISPLYLTDTLKTLQVLLALAPTDPSIYQRIGLTLAQAGEVEKSIAFFERAIELKPDYKRAKEALEYIKSGIIAQ